MDVHEARGSATTEKQTMTTTMRTQFLATLRENADAWHAGEIDFATFTASQRDTWDAIRQAGPAIEAEVLRALRDQLPTEAASSFPAARAVASGLRYRR
jgi:hypothetical protein